MWLSESETCGNKSTRVTKGSGSSHAQIQPAMSGWWDDAALLSEEGTEDDLAGAEFDELDF